MIRRIEISRSPISFLLLEHTEAGWAGAYWWIRQPGDTGPPPSELQWDAALERGDVLGAAKREAWCRKGARMVTVQALCLELFDGSRQDAGTVAAYVEALA